MKTTTVIPEMRSIIRDPFSFEHLSTCSKMDPGFRRDDSGGFHRDDGASF